MKAELYNLSNKKTGSVELPERVFGVDWNADLVHQALRTQMNNARHPFAHAKGRGEVRGGGKKPWRQKGTGRARHGSTRSPIWVGGGVTHGPVKERSYEVKINKKMRQKALFTVLSRKFKDGEIIFVDSLAIEEPKTKALNAALVNFFDEQAVKALIIPAKENRSNIFKASKNLATIKELDATSLNVYDLLRYKKIFIDKDVVEAINNHYHAA